MSGLSQAELDALCTCQEEGPIDEPPSPIGSALLARKRQRLGQRKTAVGSAEVAGDSAQTKVTGADTDQCHIKCGLSQAVLDEMSVSEPPLEDDSPSSPLGTSLRRIKNRRKYGAPLVSADQVVELQSIDIKVTPPAEVPLRCPASWSSTGGGLSQAELDAMCGEEAEDADSPKRTALSPIRTSVITSPVANAENLLRNSPLLGSKQACVSPCGSPPMRRRLKARRADAENAGGNATPIGSPVKTLERASPVADLLSPQRNATSWRAAPLSPVGFR